MLMWFRESRLASEPGEEKGRSEPAFAVQLVDLINKTENFAGFDVIPFRVRQQQSRAEIWLLLAICKVF